MTNDLAGEQLNNAAGRYESSGALYTPLHVERQVKIYPIQEHELLTISTLNDESSRWNAIGAAAVALILGCAWDTINLPKDATVSSQAILFMLGCTAIAIVAFYTAWKMRSKKQTVLDKILQEVNK
jgi:hypothetical protein